MEIYVKKPLKIEKGLPIFSASDYYVKNYEKIGKEILNNIDIHGKNPFMDEIYWNSIENSTLDSINDIIKPNDNILDVGVGLGRLLNKIKIPVNKFGVDIDVTQLLKVDSSINVCMSKVEELPYRDNFFDVIVCTDVLEHVMDLNLAIKNILRVLKPGGHLIIRVPYREDLSNYLLDSYPYQFAHLRNFDENSLQLLLCKVFGMKISKLTYCGYLNSRTKIKYFNSMKVLQKTLSLIVGFSIILGPKTQKRVMKKLLHPIEINITAMKNDKTN